jgi:L-threonylcarbamoyladenylate synthase
LESVKTDMETKIIKIENVKHQAAAIEAAAAVIKSGGIVAFPTETVYGLGANGLSAEASAGIYEAKGRPSDNPLILHISDMKMLESIAAEVTASAKKLLAAFCPGPITLILKHKPVVPLRITGGLDTVGIRMPDNDVARALIKSAGMPIAAPSANISGRPSPTTAKAVYRDMKGRIAMILDGGPCTFGIESTIVDCTGTVPTVLRPGAITMEMLAEVLGRVQLDGALSQADSIPKAPGMKYTHYAPRVPLTLLEGGPKHMADGFASAIAKFEAEGHTVGLITSREIAEVLQHEPTYVYGDQGDIDAIAACLYEALRSFDDVPVDMLLGEGTTDTGLGLAVMNRLHKASGFRTIKV